MDAPQAQPLRLGTIAIQHGRPPGVIGAGAALATSAIAKEISGLNLDVLALQEVDLSRSTLGNIEQANELANELGYQLFVAPSARGHATAILTRIPVRSWHVLTLPALPDVYEPSLIKHVSNILRAGLWGRGLEAPEPRTCLYAVLEAPNWPLFILASAHLANGGGAAREQLRIATGGIGRLENRLRRETLESGKTVTHLRPVHMLIGDLNLAPETVTTVLAEPGFGRNTLNPLAVSKTHPAWSAVAKFDHILGQGIRLLESGTHRLENSDFAVLHASVEPV